LPTYRRLGFAVIGFLAVTLGQACTRDDQRDAPKPSPSAVSSRTVGASPSPAAAAPTSTSPVGLEPFLKAERRAVVHSSPVRVGDTHVAVVGIQRSLDDRMITVVSLAGPKPAAVAELALPVPRFDIADIPVAVADVTGDGRPDFLVHMDAADNQPGVVVSDDGGAWRLVPTSAADKDAVYIGRDPAITENRLVSTRLDCNPSCTEGRAHTIRWTYQRPGGYFTSSP
jgi:hypothetical protein